MGRWLYRICFFYGFYPIPLQMFSTHDFYEYIAPSMIDLLILFPFIKYKKQKNGGKYEQIPIR